MHIYIILACALLDCALSTCRVFINFFRLSEAMFVDAYQKWR